MKLKMVSELPAPRGRSRPSQYAPALEYLRKRQGQWGLLRQAPSFNSASSTATYLKARFGSEGFAFATRGSVAEKRFEVWGSYGRARRVARRKRK